MKKQGIIKPMNTLEERLKEYHLGFPSALMRHGSRAEGVRFAKKALEFEEKSTFEKELMEVLPKLVRRLPDAPLRR